MSNHWLDDASASEQHEYLTTIQEVDEEDMDEKGLLLDELRTSRRHAHRRRWALHLCLGFALLMIIGHTILFGKSITYDRELAQLKEQQSSSTSPPLTIATIPPQNKVEAPSTPQPPKPTPPTEPQKSTSSASTSSNTATSTTSASADASSAVANPEFRAAMDEAFAAIPDGDAYAALLADPPTSPLERLDHLGRQVRAYGPLLSAYERLHEPPTGGPIHARWNVPREISRSTQRRDPDLIGTDLQKYQSFTYLFRSLSGMLWPWFRIPDEDVVALHRQIATGGRGLVMTVSDLHFARRLAVVQNLKATGLELPIEVVYGGPTTLSRANRAQFEALDGVVVTDLMASIPAYNPATDEKLLKPLAVLTSRFREAMLLNTDVLPERPGLLFDCEGYQQSGAAIMRAEGPREPDGDETRIDDGVVLVDKARHYVALLATVRLAGSDWVLEDEVLQEKGINAGTFTTEVFRLAFEISGGERFEYV